MGSWSEVSPLPTPRRLLAAAADNHGRIYTLGGCGSPCFEPPLHTDTTEETRVEVFDTTTGTWSRLPDLPAILFGAAAAAAGGRIYIFGGYLTGNLVLEFDPANPTTPWSSKSPMPTPRFGLAAVTLQDKIYVLGGSGPTGALEVYDPASDSWSERSPMPTPRVFLAAAVLGGKIYALGGSPDAGGGSQTAAVEVYDPATNRWMAAAPLPVAEQLSAAAADNGLLYAFGGFVPGAGVRGATYMYDPTTNTWAAGAPMPVARDEAPAVEVNGLAYVLGGSTNCHCRAIGTVESRPIGPPTPPPSPCIHLTKTADRAVVAPGESLSYLVRVTNCGTVPVAVTTSDEFRETGLLDGHWCRGQGCQPSIAEDLRDTRTVPVSGETVYTVAGQVPCGPSVLQNKACAAAAGLPQQCQTAVDSVTPPTADLQLTATAPIVPSSVVAGDTILYRWTVENLGPCPAQGVELSQPLLAGLDLVSASPSCLAGSGALLCGLGTLDPHAPPVQVHSRFQIPCSRPAGSFMATATVTSATIDKILANNSATVPTAVTVVADYSIAKTCPAGAIAGQQADYTLTVQNGGPSCPQATVVDVLPAHLFHGLWCPGVGLGCSPPNHGDLAAQITVTPGTTAIFSVAGVIDPGFSGMLSNTATVAVTAGYDPVSINNLFTCMTVVSPSPSGVTGSCFVTGQFSPGKTVSYTYHLMNLGSQAQSVEFTDTLPADLTLLAATADSGTVTTAPPTVTWTGQIQGNATVTVTVQAMIAVTAADREIICNQGTVFFDADGNGHFQTSQLTTGPCCLPVTRVDDVPTLAPGALGALALLLAALAHRRIGGRRRRLDGG